ncbi:hypothetical protein PENTCL1PPCAC_1287, partial [Pristionchus entomophagus]
EMSSLVEIQLPKKKQNDEEYGRAFEEFKSVVVPFLQCATFKRAFPLICAAAAGASTAEQLKERTQEMRRRINRYLKGKVDVGQYSKSIYLKTDENMNEVTCLHWNCCGLVGQTARTKDTSLLDLIVAFEPDIILLNEVKAKDEDIQAVIRGLDASAYAYLAVPSKAPKSRSMRGSIIIYRFTSKFKILLAGREPAEDGEEEAPTIEAIAVDVQMSLGKRYRLINTYVRGSDQHFEEAQQIYTKLSSGTTIVTGDLNMRKDKFVKKWKDAGFVDSLNPAWSTNKSRDSLTAIDYVMHNGKTSPLICHKPIQPDNDSVHFPILFTLGGSHSSSFCTDAACMFGCGKY